MAFGAFRDMPRLYFMAKRSWPNVHGQTAERLPSIEQVVELEVRIGLRQI